MMKWDGNPKPRPHRIKELKPPFSYDKHKQCILNVDGIKILNIQLLENPEEPQDFFGELIVEFLNEKIK